MKVSLSWLKDHLDTDADATTVAETLTRIGLEVEDVANAADALRPFRIAKVLSAAPHPQADKLQVLSVDAGGGPLQVVCGAPNARAGMVGIFGAPGTFVPGPKLTLKVAAIRGVESHGMMCSSRELELGEDHEGIVELPEDAPVGAGYAEWAGLDDPVFDIAITPNRQDCMGVRGIARDLAAAGLGTLKPLDVPQIDGAFPCPVEIRTDDPEGCPAFFGRVVRAVANGPSPEWLQRRLKSVGQRPISALVDITNYVMLGHGRPLHVYDLSRISGALVARKASDGEEVLALNGRSYTLTEGMTVIADQREVHDIGGIMGGEHSGVTDATTDVLIECAYFDPSGIARTGQALGLVSDARSRFERGVDPAFLDDGLAIATDLVTRLCGGTPSEAVRAGEPPVATRTIPYDPARARTLGGLDIPAGRQRDILERLGFSLSEDFSARVPTWRRDIDGSADLVEEVIRIEGLEKVPPAALPRAEGVARPTATPEQRIERRVRRAAAARGFAEAITWSFLPEKDAALFGGGVWSLANPISEELKVMRPSLVPGLARAAQRNRDRGERSVRLFELGRRYLEEGERATLTVLIAGEAQPRDWRAGRARPADAYDAKAEAVALLEAAGAPAKRLQLIGPGDSTWHPGRSGRLGLSPKVPLATFGELHPETLKALDVEGPVCAAEIYLDMLPARRAAGRARPPFAPPALQPVRRDFAFLVPGDFQADRLLRAVAGADKQAIAAVSLFDVFAGAGVPAGMKSLAIEVVLQPVESSFVDAELKQIADRIEAAAAKLGATLRS